MAALPLFKVFAILFKEVSKPIAARIKQSALSHPRGKMLTMALGRTYESFSVRLEHAFSGQKLKKDMPPVTDAHALTVGADVVSTSFLMSVAIALLALETWRNNNVKAEETAIAAAKKAKLEAIEEARLKAIETRLEALEELLSKSRGTSIAPKSKDVITATPLNAISDSSTSEVNPSSSTASGVGDILSWRWTSWTPPFFSGPSNDPHAAAAASPPQKHE